VEMMKSGRDRDRRGAAPLDFSRGGGRSEFRLIVSGLPKSASWQVSFEQTKKNLCVLSLN
jgi:hypothetical protein